MKTISHVKQILGYKSNSSVYSQIHKGLLPPPIKINTRSIWQDGELNLIEEATLNGLNEEQIRKIVASIMETRKQEQLEFCNTHLSKDGENE